ncbi:DMT family transporter [Flavihumibacter cheonanensis]|uniref:DMT family transporter n=1 Tax=Flavihumibacter cheonanensis TaxID=1442385 RepID=UPI001EF8680E|nr:DMT family transporter [Flavihumibacter cheonanensis]MCG7754032.1 DMT family transporter [Flavihumibacter cheonanensis]
MSPKLLNWFLFTALALIWGSSFILMKAGMEALSAYQVAAIRMLSGGLILLPMALKSFREIPREKIGMVVLSGFLGSFFPAFFFCIAETKIDSSLAGILNALTPMFTISIGALFFQLQINAAKIAGVVLGFIGLCMLFLVRGKLELSYLSYSSLVILATLCYGINVNMVARHLKGIGSVSIASFAFACLIPPSLAVLWKTGYFEMDRLPDNGTWWMATGSAVVLGVMGTALASIIFYMLVKRAGTLFASLVTYGIPFVAIGWGLLFGESITLAQVGCLLIILAGVYLVNRNK